MAEFKEVSLGFAEFVSQLIQETFDAILSSQNYQLEKYLELQNKLKLSNQAFKKNYISNDDIEDRIIEFFGFKVDEQMLVNEELSLFLENTFEADQNLVNNKKLTSIGYESIYDYITNLIIEERKELLNTLINNSNISNIIVDSGEIIAKLELTNLFTQDNNSENEKPIKQPTRLELKKISKAKAPIKELALPTFKRKINVIDFKDAKSGKTTILIDKKAVKNSNDSNFQIPNVRLSVQPVKLTETSNLYSEIKINFKTK